MCDEKKARDFRKYGVWQDAVAYATHIYKITEQMPWFEKKSLCDQLRRAVVSISSNIAEGSAKPSDVDFARFLDQALGSAFEVETQLIISQNVGYISQEQCEELIKQNKVIQKQIVALIRNIRQKQSS